MKDENFFYNIIKYIYILIRKNFFPINWYETDRKIKNYKKNLYKRKKIKLIIIKSRKDINKFNLDDYFEKYKFKLDRFGKKINFLVLVDNKKFLSTGWIFFGDKWNISEIQKKILLRKQYLLFDFETPHLLRKKGYYTLLLKLIKNKYRKKILAIYSDSNNFASNKAIKRSGFKFVRRIYG
tara:strand:+ start:51 stop:593 length:543 start_codon:yes stop_codon:yes gene_type:complete